MDPAVDGFPPLFVIAFAAVVLAVLVVIVFTVVGAVRSRRVLRDRGLDPMTAHAQLVAGIAQGPLGTAPQSLDQRLTELDDLLRRGRITAAEHAAARAAALGAH